MHLWMNFHNPSSPVSQSDTYGPMFGIAPSKQVEPCFSSSKQYHKLVYYVHKCRKERKMTLMLSLA